MLREYDSAPVGLINYLRILRRRRLILVGVLVAALAAAAAISYKQRPLYEAQSKIVVGQGNTLFQAQNGNVIQPFTATMSNLLTSNIVADEVRAALGLSGSSATLLKNVSVSINPQTAVMQLSVTDHSPRRAREINAEFGTVFSRLVKARFALSSGGVNGQPPISATVFDPAHILPGKVSPSPAQNLLIAGVLGLLLGIAAAFVRDHFDPILRTEEELEAAFDCPVIGRIPARRNGRGIASSRGDRWLPRNLGRKGLDVGRVANPDVWDEPDGVWDQRTDATEAYRMLRATLGSRVGQQPLRTLLVTSVASSEGKSAVAANLACAFARAGARTLLVEADLREPLLDEAIGRGGIGLTGVLAGRGTLAEAVEVDVLPAAQRGGGRGRPRRQSQELNQTKLSFLPGGGASAQTSDLLASVRMAELIDNAASRCDYILLDAPPLLLAADAFELARAVDGVILVTRPGQVRGDQAREVRAIAERLDIHLAGLVLTGAEGRVSGTLESARVLEPSGPVLLRTARAWVSGRSP